MSPFDALTFDRHPSDTIPDRPTDPDGRPRLVDLVPPVAPRDEAPGPARAEAPRAEQRFSERPAPSRDAVPGRATAAPAVELPAAYEIFYGFSEKPFSLSTDPRFFFHSTPHDAVSQQLLTATRNRGGLVVLTGDIGAGKTTLCRTVIEQLDRRTLTSLVTDRAVSGEGLLKTILADFGVASREELERRSATSHDLSATLLSFVESLATLQATAIVIIDDAENLPPDVLEQVRILSEAGETSSLLQVVLVGQPGLTARLRRKEYKGLHQRVTVWCTLERLPPDEVDGYVMHRIAVSSTSARVQFDQAAIDSIYRLSRGLPRVINLLCDRALAHGHELSSPLIDAAVVEAAAEDLDLGEPRPFALDLASNAVTVVALVLSALLGAAVAARLFPDAFARALAIFR